MRGRILVVDDAIFMRKMLTDILENNDFQVVGEGMGGCDALKMYASFDPDVVTMDITMPNCLWYRGCEKNKEPVSKGKDCHDFCNGTTKVGA